MFSSIAQMFKQQNVNTQNNFKNPDIPKITFEMDKKINLDLGANLFQNYNNLSLKQIMNGQSSIFSKDLVNLGKTSIRLDDKETYRKMLNSNQNNYSQTKIINEYAKNLLSNQNTKKDFSFLLKKNDGFVKNNWYNNAIENKKEQSQISTIYKQPFKSFNQLNNFPYSKRISLLENLKKISAEEYNNSECIDLDYDLNDAVQRTLVVNKQFYMEYDDNHFGNVSKGTSSLCISEAWEDIEEDMEFEITDKDKFDQNFKTNKPSAIDILDKNFASKITESLEEKDKEQNRILKEKENKFKEVEENTRLTIEELEKINKDRMLKVTNISKLKYYPPCYDIEQEDKLSDIEYPPEDDFSDIENLKEENDEISLSDLIVNEVHKIISIKNMNHKITDKYDCEITRKDIETLQGLNWLNDEIINFYFNMIVERNPKDLYCFNTFFYSKLKESGHKALRRWTKKVDIFSFKLILIPIHLGMHWTLASINMVKKEINYYDSMNGNNQECLKLLLCYLRDELLDKKKQTLDTENWKLTIVKGIPQQMNGSDCGMFTCKYADYLSRKKEFTFNQSSMPYFRTRMIYEIVKGKLLN